MARVPAAYAAAQDAFAAAFGRRPPDPVVPYRLDDAQVALVCMGTTAATARAAVDRAREEGIAAGLLRVHMFRPLPEPALRHHLAGVRRVAVVDRDLCPGLGGILWSEVRALAAPGALVQGYASGLGGGDVCPEHLLAVLHDAATRAEAAPLLFQEVG
jgi:pyruvate/2-oxoacid:ferredoxin oxidoreductase alpha subunit